ncbi:MarR family winged helix-turn-helix transcriptional regulator [Ornithinimicrobium pekingense]|uniref:HTH marR-type domain-containing protein n=1 Tax=Ornithinimicrobium pekingense TaxID=384677 RepID=A0ABQ2F3V0_9MICO|nr:MarR family winged helix-turn-helix transcriptional regulator [Ornithinimicrobium pekingense]GGK58602.1 hypothetical protein GCM10011509_03750 [Ornithinimicrobium pekingense]
MPPAPLPPGASAEVPDDSSEVDLLMRLARRWRRLGAQEAPGQGLSPHQERALLAVARLSRGPAGQPGHDGGGPAEHRAAGHGAAEHRPPAPGVRVSSLAAHLGIAPRSATEVADALEAAGLLSRAADPTDRRAVLLTLTDEGRHTVGQVRERRRAAADAAVERLSPADRAELRRLLQALLDA